MYGVQTIHELLSYILVLTIYFLSPGATELNFIMWIETESAGLIKSVSVVLYSLV